MKPNFPFWLSRPIQDCHFYSKQLNSGNTRAELSADPTVLPLTLAFFLHERGLLDRFPWPVKCKTGTLGASFALVDGLFCCSPTKVQSISEATMPIFVLDGLKFVAHYATTFLNLLISHILEFLFLFKLPSVEKTRA